VSLWHCYEHPDGTSSSMYDAPHILCGSASWRDLVAMAIVACLIFCVGFLALVCYAVYVAPIQMASAAFRTRWRFLFVRFRPSTWWWGMLLMIRGLWFCLSTTIFDMGFRQLLWVQVMLVTYVLSCCGMLPWRSMAVSALDICTHMALIMLCSIFVAHTTTETSGFVTFVLLFSGPMVFAGVLMIFLTTQHFARHTKSEIWELRAEQLRQVLQAASRAENLGYILSRIPLADLTVIVLAKQLLQAEVLGHQPMLNRSFSPILLCTNANFEGHRRPVFRTESFATNFADHVQDLEAPGLEAGTGHSAGLEMFESQSPAGSAQVAPSSSAMQNPPLGPVQPPRRLAGWSTEADVTDTRSHSGLDRVASEGSHMPGLIHGGNAHNSFTSVVPIMVEAPQEAENVRRPSAPAPLLPPTATGVSFGSQLSHPSQVCEAEGTVGSHVSADLT